MRNIETKAQVEDLQHVLDRALSIGAEDHGVQRDTDTYFRVANGRLKLRVSEGVHGGTLIAYQRPDLSGSRDSDYRLVAIPDPAALCEALHETLGVLVEVRKRRHLLIYGATRIHLDEVDDLGSFVELETVLIASAPRRGGSRARVSQQRTLVWKLPARSREATAICS